MRWFQTANCQGGGRNPSALAFVGAGYGQAVREALQKIPAKDVIFRDVCPEERAWMPVRAVWKPDSLTAPAASRFIEVLARICGDGKGEAGDVARPVAKLPEIRSDR
jgi:DNA-binding transcriptional LysR family regulator